MPAGPTSKSTSTRACRAQRSCYAIRQAANCTNPASSPTPQSWLKLLAAQADLTAVQAGNGVDEVLEGASSPVKSPDGDAMLPSLDAILTLRCKLVQPDLKIDTGGTEIKIDVDPTLPHGTIVLVDASGAKLYEP